ncbi:MAG: biosynthetic peptidoglycan transglycosylase [Fidelibacterota bacterium]
MKKKSIPELDRLIRQSTYLQGEISRTPTRNGKWIRREQLPHVLVLLLLSSEDRRFYEHHGVDFFRVLKILLNPRASRSVHVGGSTLTQQLVKTIWGSCDRTIWNKIHEMSGALIVESLLKKDEILELYVNCIMWSPNAVGLSSAVRKLFGKEVEELSPDDMILLVAGLPNPEALAEFIIQGKPNRRLLNRVQRLKSEAENMGISP